MLGRLERLEPPGLQVKGSVLIFTLLNSDLTVNHTDTDRNNLLFQGPNGKDGEEGAAGPAGPAVSICPHLHPDWRFVCWNMSGLYLNLSSGSCRKERRAGTSGSERLPGLLVLLFIKASISVI